MDYKRGNAVLPLVPHEAHTVALQSDSYYSTATLLYIAVYTQVQAIRAGENACM